MSSRTRKGRSYSSGQIFPDVTKKMEFKFCPIPVECANYVILLPPDSEEGQLAFEQIKDQIGMIDKLMQVCLEESEKERPLLFNMESISERKKTIPLVNACEEILFSLQKEIVEYTEAYFMGFAAKVSQLTHFLIDCESHKCSARIDFDGFRHHIEKQYMEDQIVISLKQRKIPSLDRFAKRFRYSPRYPDIPKEQLIAALKENSKSIQEAIEYSPHGAFDDLFFFYIMSNDKLDEFDDICINIMNDKNPKFYNFSAVSQLIASYYFLFEAQTTRSRIVIKSSIIRIFFDRFYVYNHLALTPNGSTTDLSSRFLQFERICKKVRESTPRENGINSKLLLPNTFDTPFFASYSDNIHIKEALRHLSMVQFFNNPIDILDSVFKALKCSELFVKSNEKSHKNIKNNECDAGSSMSFDEFFPLFLTIFSMSPPVNSLEIHSFLIKMSGIDQSSALDFAKMIFISTVGYLLDLKDL